MGEWRGGWTFDCLVFIGGGVFACRDGHINGGLDSLAVILEWDLMAECVRRSRPSMRDGTLDVIGRCQRGKWLVGLVDEDGRR